MLFARWIVPAVAASVVAFVGQNAAARWQHRQHAFEVRSELIAELSNASALLMSAVQTREFEGNTEKLPSFVADFRRWDEQSQVIDAKIETYYKSGQALERQWQRFVEAMRLYALLPGEPGQRAGKNAKFTRSSTRDATLARLGDAASVRIPQRLRARPVEAGSSVAYDDAWVTLKVELIRRRDQLVNALEANRLVVG
jgi:hypothetical protein